MGYICHSPAPAEHYLCPGLEGSLNCYVGPSQNMPVPLGSSIENVALAAHFPLVRFALIAVIGWSWIAHFRVTSFAQTPVACKTAELAISNGKSCTCTWKMEFKYHIVWNKEKYFTHVSIPISSLTLSPEPSKAYLAWISRSSSCLVLCRACAFTLGKTLEFSLFFAVKEMVNP